MLLYLVFIMTNAICSLLHITKHPTCLDGTGNTQNQAVCPWPYSKGKALKRSRWGQWGTVSVAGHKIWWVLTFLNSANADPKAGFIWVLSLIHWGSLLNMAGRVYLWSRSRMLAKSFWWRMALPVQRIKIKNGPVNCSQTRKITFPSSVMHPFSYPPPSVCFVSPSLSKEGWITYRLVYCLHAQVFNQHSAWCLASSSGLERNRQVSTQGRYKSNWGVLLTK